MNTHPQYPTDLNDSQWQFLNGLDLLPQPKWHPGGPGRKPCELHIVINGILYVTKTGCQWRMLPLEFGKWQTVYGYFNRWRQQGIWQKIREALVKKERQRQDRNPKPSAGCVDSQSVKTATQKETKGYDAGKQINGRKRHLLVDTLGLIIAVFVSAANGTDRDGLKQVLRLALSRGWGRFRKLWVDGGYRGDELKDWVAALKQTHKIDLEVVARDGKGFQLVKRRWVVERTFAWLLTFRRLSKDYEVETGNSEAFIDIAMTHLLLKRLAA